MPAGKTESNTNLPLSLPTGTLHVSEGSRRSNAAPLRVWHSACGALLAIAALAGCDQKSAEKCDQAQSTVRQALQVGDFAAAKEWRTYAYKQCSDTGALSALDREIVDKETQVAEAKQREEAEAAQAKQYVDLFTKFVADHRAAPEKTSSSPECGDDAAAARTKQRWCKVSRKVGDAGTFDVRYWEADPKLVRFSTNLPKAASCEDLGGSATVVKSWDVSATGGSAKRFHCDMTGGPLQGLRVVVTAAKGAQAHVFSPEYLEADAALRKYAQAE